jgi:hypothetical protein
VAYIPGETITYGDEQWICTTSTTYNPTTSTAHVITTAKDYTELAVSGNLEPNALYWVADTPSIDATCVDSRSLVDEVIAKLEERVKFKPMTCKCCGGTINREGMFCDFCGTKYKLGADI